MNVFRIYANTEMSPWLHKIKFPTLVLTGKNDVGSNSTLNKFIAEKISQIKNIPLEEVRNQTTQTAKEFFGI